MSSETIVTTKANNVIIASVPCPTCQADAGSNCIYTDGIDVGGFLDGIHGSRHQSYMMVFRADVVKPEPTYSEFDEVTRPKHYNSHPSGIECITIAQHHNYNIGAAIKYLWRQGLKDGAASITDMRKAIQYIEFEIKLQGGDVRERGQCDCSGSYQCENHRSVRNIMTHDMTGDEKARATFPIPEGYAMLRREHTIRAGDMVWDGTKFVPVVDVLINEIVGDKPYPVIRAYTADDLALNSLDYKYDDR